MLFTILNQLSKCIFTPSVKGSLGESQVENQLYALNNAGCPGRVLKNLYVPTQAGGTTEIDAVYLTQKGIFVLESKNYAGKIYVKPEEKDWKISYKGGRKESLYNPIWQNASHIKWLKKYLGKDIPCHSIIVFSNRGVLKNRAVALEDAKVINQGMLFGTIRQIFNKSADVIPTQELDRCYEALCRLTNAERDVKVAHIKDVKASAKSMYQKASNELFCPVCGKNLVMRTARNGENAGKKFYGCGGYPVCHYTRSA